MARECTGKAFMAPVNCARCGFAIDGKEPFEYGAMPDMRQHPLARCFELTKVALNAERHNGDNVWRALQRMKKDRREAIDALPKLHDEINRWKRISRGLDDANV